MEDLLFNYLKGSLFLVLLFVAVSGGFLLILRPLVLWYYKIFGLMSKLQENNALLREIRDELRKKNVLSPSHQKESEDYSKYMPK